MWVKQLIMKTRTFYANDGEEEWVVFKSFNTEHHGTSNNTRTELAQLKKWSPLTNIRWMRH